MSGVRPTTCSSHFPSFGPSPLVYPSLGHPSRLPLKWADMNEEQKKRVREGLGRSAGQPESSDTGRTRTRTRVSNTPSRRKRARSADTREELRGGHHESRMIPLAREDLYVDGRLPARCGPSRRSQRCSLCKEAKAHPISYLCGHSHCYACVRLWLEFDWKYPVASCGRIMTHPPHRHVAEEESLAEDFPVWVKSTGVTYSWDGLTFPQAESSIVEVSGDDSS
ncbi:hypothetical protein B0H16DRAFT_1448413 [Mycena metata]|uniref:Zinc finger C3HC4 RING-type domain-containing protein n=1 Tax=Mycena metata TaxID=1033252 RepID=A0AAD7NYA6_9AGAR|nr:hypothetical protein B0H16DRAFT_1448413 [Mycena metata]